jgi:hypothetical protein
MKTKQSENNIKLINEPPLLLLPTLAKELGVNAAIILQQIHYWLEKELNTRDDHYWVYHSYNTWTEQFPFFSQSQIKHAIRKLEKRGILIIGNYNKRSMDKTKWYRINYEEFERIFPSDKIVQPLEKFIQSSDKIIPSSDKIVQPLEIIVRPLDNDSQAIPEITSETTSKITTDNKEKNKTYTPPENIIEEMFNRFWTLYPKKVAKKKAYSSFIKIKGLDNEKLEKIMKVLGEQIKSINWQKDKGQFIPYPTTWINEERWEDEIIIPHQQKEQKLIPEYLR